MSDLTMQATCLRLVEQGPLTVFTAPAAYRAATGREVPAQAVWQAMDALEARGLVVCSFDRERAWRLAEGE